jgi:hypothetical protein
MPKRSKPNPPDPFKPVDHRLLQILGDNNIVQRSILCAFARLGTAWRRVESQRTEAWLAQLEPHPFYKGGQFLFDLLEVEDFMLDGPPPPLASNEELVQIAARLAALTGLEIPAASVRRTFAALPPLEPGFYLYRDVLLGIAFTLVSSAEELA